MREICVKTKPSGVGMTGYAQMVCAGRYTFTQLKCVETALHTSTKTAHNIDGTHYVFDLHSERRSSKRLLIRWSRVRISPDPPVIQRDHRNVVPFLLVSGNVVTTRKQ